ncbi:TetR/AcrR family transcriptional regulator [Spirillospora sp. NPDC047279]|uniref:TetR/AcrR family transcriptional regulator n=1 Tax=Spirillospora sp. NPDC047279 TaxID=3155478 RepID=UPI0033E730C2
MPEPSDRRTRLIGAFVRVAAERGFARTTAADVAAEARLPEQEFHACFSDMEDCFLAAYEHGCGVLYARVEDAYRAAPSWHDGIRAGLRVMLEALAGDPALTRLSVMEATAAGPRVRRARFRVMAGYRAFLACPGRPGIPDAVRDAIIGGIYGTIYDYVDTGRTAELPDLLPAMTCFTLLPYTDIDDALKELGPSGPAPGRPLLSPAEGEARNT